MNSFKRVLFLICLGAFFNAASVLAQVQLNIVYHPLSDIHSVSDFRCLQDKKDLLIFYELETFVTHASFLRFELLDLIPTKAHFLVYNDEIEQSLTEQRPHFLKQIKRGPEAHRFILRIKNTSSGYCEYFQDSIMVSLEPI